METEYIVWGLTKEQNDKLQEQPLYTKAARLEQANKAMEILSKKYGCHAMRIQVIDGTLLDFAEALNI